jgi:hypothetical protein
MRCEIAEEQRALKKDEARSPDGCGSAQQGEDSLSSDWFDEKKEGAAEEDRDGVSSDEPWRGRVGIVHGQ